MKITTNEKVYSNDLEKECKSELLNLFNKCPIPDHAILENLGIFLTSKNLSRILFMNFIYSKIVDVQGVVLDFGTRWGLNLTLFAALRGIYEPFNRHRKIIGFDTFEGFPVIAKEDGKSDLMEEGSATVTERYKDFLSKLMRCHEKSNPLSHIQKFDILAGDACNTIDTYIEARPHTIVALAYFDFDLYLPTKKCLDSIKDRLVKGSVLAFDELNDHDSPGETVALMESIGLNNIRLKRHRYTSRVSYYVVE